MLRLYVLLIKYTSELSNNYPLHYRINFFPFPQNKFKGQLFLRPLFRYLKNSHQCPQQRIEIFPIAPVRVEGGHVSWAELATEEVHTKYANTHTLIVDTGTGTGVYRYTGVKV